MVRRHAASVGVQARLASRAIADRSGYGLRGSGRRRVVSLDATAARTGRNCPGCAATAPGPAGSRAPAACACTPSFSIPAIPNGSSSRFRRRARSAPTMAARPGSRSIEGCDLEVHSRPDAEVGHCVHHVAMHPSRPDVLFMQKHWDVMRSDDAGETGAKSAGICPPISDSPSTCTRTNRRRFTWCRSRAIRSIFRSTESCACIAAAPAETSGSR